MDSHTTVHAKASTQRDRQRETAQRDETDGRTDGRTGGQPLLVRKWPIACGMTTRPGKGERSGRGGGGVAPLPRCVPDGMTPVKPQLTVNKKQTEQNMTWKRCSEIQKEQMTEIITQKKENHSHEFTGTQPTLLTLIQYTMPVDGHT